MAAEEWYDCESPLKEEEGIDDEFKEIATEPCSEMGHKIEMDKEDVAESDEHLQVASVLSEAREQEPETETPAGQPEGQLTGALVDGHAISKPAAKERRRPPSFYSRCFPLHTIPEGTAVEEVDYGDSEAQAGSPVCATCVGASCGPCLSVEAGATSSKGQALEQAEDGTGYEIAESANTCLACGDLGCSLCSARAGDRALGLDVETGEAQLLPPAAAVAADEEPATVGASRLEQQRAQHTLLNKEGLQRREKERKVAVMAFLKEHGFRGVKAPKRSMLKGCTYALHRAVERGIPHIVGMLLEEGADPLQKDSKGMTAAQIAREKDKDGSHAGVLFMLRRWDLQNRGGQQRRPK